MQTKFKKFNKVPLLISLIFFLLPLGAFIFVYKTIESNNKMSEEVATAAHIEESKREEIKSLNRILRDTKEEQIILDSHFIRTSDVVPLLDSIEKSAPLVNTKAEVILVDVSPDQTSLFVSVNAEGSFENLYKFLTLLENSHYPVEIISMDMQKISDESAAAPTPELPETEGEDTEIVAPVKPVKTPKWGMVLRMKVLTYLK